MEVYTKIFRKPKKAIQRITWEKIW